MKKINYGLIISDFDGTLAGNDGKISELNKIAIQNYIDAGGIFVISTGRLPSAVLPRINQLGIKGLLCCGHGTVIIDIESREIIFSEKLTMEAALTACRKMESMDLHIHAFDLWDYYSNKDDIFLKEYEKAVNVKAIVVDDQKISDYLEEQNKRVYKLMAVLEAKDSDRVMKQLLSENLPGCGVTKSMDTLVEIVNPMHSKGSAVCFLAEHYGISLDKTIAIGDNYNDISMIERAGLGVAVENAEDALKCKADYVCEYSNEQSAVAAVIEKFGFYTVG